MRSLRAALILCVFTLGAAGTASAVPTVSVEFEGGLSAQLGVHGHASQETRTIRVTGTEGELRGRLHDGRIEITRHGRLESERIELEGSPLGHYGGDDGLVAHFVDLVEGADSSLAESRTSGRISLESHLLGFAAERARERGEVVDLEGFREEMGATRR